MNGESLSRTYLTQNTALPGSRDLSSIFGLTASAAGLPIPLSLLLAVGIPLISSLFEEDEEQKMLDRAMQMRNLMRLLGIRQPYQSPFLPSADRAFYQMLLQNLKRYANWGYPSGMGIDTSWIEDLIKGIGSTSPIGSRKIRLTGG
ncbi:MAG: hypothetical protein J7L26_12570 [Candidatus Aminicenantes bacterium]|nr:hypothetical protein [Candidatus Aminicenantes bacterium]